MNPPNPHKPDSARHEWWRHGWNNEDKPPAFCTLKADEWAAGRAAAEAFNQKNQNITNY